MSFLDCRIFVVQCVAVFLICGYKKEVSLASCSHEKEKHWYVVNSETSAEAVASGRGSKLLKAYGGIGFFE